MKTPSSIAPIWTGFTDREGDVFPGELPRGAPNKRVVAWRTAFRSGHVEVGYFKCDAYRSQSHQISLTDAVVRQARLDRVILNGADLRRADFTGASLAHATLLGTVADNAVFHRANLFEARLACTSLLGTDLREAQLNGADLSGANLVSADLRGANISRATIVETELENANLSGCRVYGVAVILSELSRPIW